jgi:hypothetical protein
MSEVILNQNNQLESSIETLLLQIESLVIKTGVTLIQALEEVLKDPDAQEIAQENETLRQIFDNLFNQSVYRN